MSSPEELLEKPKKKLRPDEPDFKDIEFSENDPRIIAANTWYREKYKNDHKEWISWLTLYLEDEEDSEGATIARQIPKGKVQINICAIARMLYMGAILPSQTITFFEERVEKLLEEFEHLADTSASTSNKLSPIQNLREKTNELIALIEDELDKFTDNQNHQFFLADILKKHGMKSVYAQAVYDYYLPKLAEVMELENPECDEQLKEGYKNYSEERVWALKDFLTTLLVQAKEWVDAGPQRKPRKKRKKDPKKVIAKVKYRESDPELGLTGLTPLKILEAGSVWIYNAKYRVLTHYVAADDTGLSIKGTTIINFDESKSIGKKLRKPAEFIKNILTGGKVAVRKEFDALNTTRQIARGRLNEDSLIVRTTN